MTRRELALSMASAAAGSNFSNLSKSGAIPFVANSNSNSARTTGSVSGKLSSSKIAFIYKPVPPTIITFLPRACISVIAARALS